MTEEFHPGFRNSTASYTVSLLNPEVIRDLQLAAHGLEMIERPFSNFLPLPGDARRYLKVGGGLAATQAEVAKFSRRDARGAAGVLRDARSRRRGAARPARVDAAQRRRAAWRTSRRCSTPGRSRSASARSILPGSATCWTCSPRAPATCSTAGSSRRRSRRRSASTASSATSAARTRRVPPTCCCTTCSARSTAGRGSGATRAAAWARSRRRWRSECEARGVTLRTLGARRARAGARRARRRRRARGRAGHRGAARGRQRQPAAAVRAPRSPRTRCPPISVRASPRTSAGPGRSG